MDAYGFEHTGSYLDYYNTYIKPSILKLDIIIKSGMRIKNSDLAEILDLDISEVYSIRERFKLKSLNRDSVLTLLNNGSSEICKMYQREIEQGSPFVYSIEQISYIYGIDLHSLKETCDSLRINQITWQNMPDVFRVTPYVNAVHS